MFKDTCLGLERHVAQLVQKVALTALQRITLEGRRIAVRKQRTLLRVHVITYKQEIEEQ
jgi:hypothetical protein